MKAGYYVAKWISGQMRSRGYNGMVTWLAARIGRGAAKYIVSTIARAGATAAAGAVAGYLGAGGALAGPLGWLIGQAAGWL